MSGELASDDNVLVKLAVEESSGLVVLDETQQLVVVEDGGAGLDAPTTAGLLVLEEESTHAQTGDQGPAGPTGSTGQSALPSVFYPAGGTLGGHRAVWIDGGMAMYASHDAASADAVLGITLGAAVFGGQVEIRYAGVVTEPSWAWTPGDPVYLSTNGMLTQVAPATGALVELGVALTATSLNIRIQEAIYRG